LQSPYDRACARRFEGSPLVKRTPVRSSPDPEDPRVWVELDAEDGSLTVHVRNLNGLVPYREEEAALSGGRVTAYARKKLLAAQAGAVGERTFARSTELRGEDEEFDPDRPQPADEVHLLMLTLDGDLLFAPTSRVRGSFYAHLGAYDPATGEWELLEFVDDAPPATQAAPADAPAP
jgi:hypothetical protein